MKKYILALACVISGVQTTEAQEYFSSASDFARLYVGEVEPQYQMWTWKDSPYYKDDPEMYKGRISYHGVVYNDVQMRFDLYKQQLAVLTPQSNILCLPEQKYIDWFEMDGHRYVHDPEDSLRYAYVLSDGSQNGVQLYRSSYKIFSGEKDFGDKMMLKTLSPREHYLLVTPDGEMHHVKKAKDVAQIFPEQKKQIRQYARRNHLSFSKRNREESLTALAGAIEGTSRRYEGTEVRGYEITPATDISRTAAPTYPRITDKIDESKLIAGIPVLDSDTLQTAGSAKTKVYVVPGVKKAKVSVADDQELAEIVVVGGRQSAVESLVMGSEKFKPQILKNIPSAFGESDIMKIVLTLPGVTTVGEASSGYNVRGGATDQNLILFNGGTVYNPSHLFGLFTSFNSDAVEDVELFKSSIPAEYGGRISSVLKVNSKEANMQKLTGSASIGLLTSKANLEIPIVKDHVSLLLNGRTTYSDWILKKLPEKSCSHSAAS